MLFGKLLAIGLLGAASVHAQMTNTTLLGILNTTQLSPANKFMELLESNPKYKPLLDILSSPGNYTVFVPSDKAFQQMNETSSDDQQQQEGGQQEEGSGNQEPPPEQNGGQDGNQGGDQGGDQGGNQGGDQGGSQGGQQEEGSGSQEPPPGTDQQQNAAFYAKLPLNLRILQQQNSTDSNSTSNSTQYNPFQEGPLQNYTLENLVQYHIINGSYLLKDLKNNTVLHTALTNSTLDRTNIGLPLAVIYQNVTSNSTEGNSTEGQEQYRVFQQGNSTTNGTSQNETEIPREFMVGNGLNFSNVTLYDIKASNGVLHVIDKVLIPPGNATVALQNDSETQTIANFAQQNQSAADRFNSLQNITVFAPSDEALKNANLSGGIQILEALSNFESQPSDIQQLVKDHIVPGLYYFNNLTQLSRSKGGSSLKNENGGTVYLSQANETSIRVNNTAWVTQPNVLTNNGVIHVINGVLGTHSQQQQGQGQQGQGQGQQGQGQGQQGQGQGQQGQDQGQQGQDQGQQGQDQGQGQQGQDQGQGQQGQDQGQQGQDQGQQGQDQGQQGQDQGQQGQGQQGQGQQGQDQGQNQGQ